MSKDRNDPWKVVSKDRNDPWKVVSKDRNDPWKVVSKDRNDPWKVVAGQVFDTYCHILILPAAVVLSRIGCLLITSTNLLFFNCIILCSEI